MDHIEAWHLAALFKDRATAQRIFQTIYDDIGMVNRTATVLNMLYRGDFCVVAYGPGKEPDRAVKRLVEKCFDRNGGTAIVLADSTVQDLMEKRAKRRPEAQLSNKGITYESHTPHALLSSNLTKEENEPYLRRNIQALLASGIPFFEVYKAYISANYQIRLSVIAEHAKPNYLARFTEKVDVAAKYIFTQSARAMHKAVYEESSEWIDTGECDLWIEQDEAQPFPAYDTTIKAVHVVELRDIHQDVLQVSVIDELARHRFTFLYDPSKRQYEATVDYECLHKQCKTVQQQLPGGYLSFYREACLACEAEMAVWSQWLHTALRMIRKDFATRPDPDDFKQRIVSYSQKKKMPRHHGKGAPKEKMVAMSTTYTTIAYDVSEVPVVPHFDEEDAPHEKGENWLTMHNRDDIIYIKRSIASHPRRYPVKRDGTRTSGMVTVNYPDGKYVPMLKPELRKSQPIKKVTAKKYQNAE